MIEQISTELQVKAARVGQAERYAKVISDAQKHLVAIDRELAMGDASLRQARALLPS